MRTPRATTLRLRRPRTCAATTEELPLRSRLAMTLMIGVDGDDPGAALALLESPTRPGGVFVRGGTAIWEDRTLVTPLGDDLPLLVAVDDEGGRVQPMEGVLGELASAAALAGESVESIESAAADRGADLRGSGHQHGAGAGGRRRERRRDRRPVLR